MNQIIYVLTGDGREYFDTLHDTEIFARHIQGVVKVDDEVIYDYYNTTDLTFERLAQEVADCVDEEMSDHNCDTFQELKEVYRQKTNDVKEYVDEIIRGFSGKKAYIDEYDHKDVFINGFSGQQMMAYADFSKLWKKYLKQMAPV